MAWEWIGTTVAGVAGITATYWTAKRGREHAERLSTAAQDHARKLAREERRQKRIGQAYEELLIQVELVGQWASMVRPMLSSAGDPKPELPGFPEQARIQALVLAHASPVVKARQAAWMEIIREMIHTDYGIELAERTAARSQAIGIDGLELRRKLDLELRPAERKKRAELAEEIAKELRGMTF
jgi:hypothetical protein